MSMLNIDKLELKLTEQEKKDYKNKINGPEMYV